MMKKTLYPKTTRFGLDTTKVVLTEKVDGSNLGFFVKDNRLFIAQRNNIIPFAELDESKDVMYGGLYGWLKEHGQAMQNLIYADSVVFGEWVGMGRLKYDKAEFSSRFLMFAKARVDDELAVTKMVYDHEYFQYVFDGYVIPPFIGEVPLVAEFDYIPSLDELNKLYDEYTAKVRRDVEGFVMNVNNTVRKYVRMKNGKLAPHTTKGE